MLSKCLLHCETVILELYSTTGKTLKIINIYTKFLCALLMHLKKKKSNNMRDTIVTYKIQLLKDLGNFGS